MSRCKACDTELEDYELMLDNPSSGEPEDLCTECRSAAYESLQEIEEDDLLMQLDELQAIIENTIEK